MPDIQSPKKPFSAAAYYIMRGLPLKPFLGRQMTNPDRDNKALQPEKFSPEVELLIRQCARSRILTICADAPERRTNSHIIFLHGGGYAMQALSFHRRFAEQLAVQTGSYVSLLDFPLPPEVHCMETLNAVMRMYTALSLLYQHHRLILMGDSAGGGLALALRQLLNNTPAGHPAGEHKRHVVPDRLVLYSPWLDISLSNLDSRSYHVRREALLPLAELQKSGKRYAGGLCMYDPRCSPLYGQVEELGKIQIFISEDELFYPDCMRFYERAAQARGTEIEVISEKRRLHCWPLLGPTFEQKNNFQQMATFCGCPTHSTSRNHLLELVTFFHTFFLKAFLLGYITMRVMRV